MGKKGQAMLNFLTSYGWAILIVLIVLGLIFYFSVLKSYPQTCVINNDNFICNEFTVKPTQVEMLLKNNGEEINNIDIKVMGCSTKDINADGDDVWASGEELSLVLNNCVWGKDKIQAQISINYNSEESVTGMIKAKVLEAD